MHGGRHNKLQLLRFFVDQSGPWPYSKDSLTGRFLDVAFDEATLEEGRRAGLYEDVGVSLVRSRRETQPAAWLCFEVKGVHWQTVLQAAATHYQSCLRAPGDWYAERKQTRVLAAALIAKRNLLERDSVIFTDQDVLIVDKHAPGRIAFHTALRGLEESGQLKIHDLQVRITPKYRLEQPRPYFWVALTVSGDLAAGRNPYESTGPAGASTQQERYPRLEDTHASDGVAYLHIDPEWSVTFRKNFNPYELLRMLFRMDGAPRAILEFGDAAYEVDRIERPSPAVLKKWANAAYNANRRIAEKTPFPDFLLSSSRWVRVNPKHLS